MKKNDKEELLRKIVEMKGRCYSIGCSSCPLVEYCSIEKRDYIMIVTWRERLERAEKMLKGMIDDEVESMLGE